MSLPPPSSTIQRQVGCCSCCQKYTGIAEKKVITELLYLLSIYEVVLRESPNQSISLKQQKISDLLQLFTKDDAPTHS
jgi:hypothetical protein